MKRLLTGGQKKIVDASGTSAQARGQAAEHIAERFLLARGARILARNVLCRGGEIDLIALDSGTVAFVEVRLRSGNSFGGSAASITPSKQRRIILAAQYWLSGAGRAMAQYPCRFDAVLLRALDPPQIEWLRGAFELN